VATVSQAIPSLYLLPLPRPNRDSDKDVVFLDLVVQFFRLALGMFMHQELGEEVISS
jgi:hypothetical protein